jgi:hypothetical protein
VEARFALEELPAIIRDVAGFRAGLVGATPPGCPQPPLPHWDIEPGDGASVKPADGHALPEG